MEEKQPKKVGRPRKERPQEEKRKVGRPKKTRTEEEIRHKLKHEYKSRAKTFILEYADLEDLKLFEEYLKDRRDFLRGRKTEQTFKVRKRNLKRRQQQEG